jgi:hypothetical protein
MPPAQESYCGKLLEATGAIWAASLYQPSSKVFSRCGERISGSPGTAPILPEPPRANNQAEPVIHRLSVRESCVFHSIHNFTSIFRAAPGRGQRPRAGCGRAPNSGAGVVRDTRRRPPGHPIWLLFVDTCAGARLQSLGSAPARPLSRRLLRPAKLPDSWTEW